MILNAQDHETLALIRGCALPSVAEQALAEFKQRIFDLATPAPPIRYEVRNTNTGEVHKWVHIEDATDDFEELSKNGAAHGQWRLIAVLGETTF